MDCKYNYSNDKNINKAIIALADNNANYGFRLAKIAYSDQFADFLSTKKLNTTDVTKIPASKLKGYLKTFYNRHYIDVGKITKETTSVGNTLFKDSQVASVAREHFAYQISYLNSVLNMQNNKYANNPFYLINTLREYAATEINKLFDEYENYNNTISEDDLDKLETIKREGDEKDLTMFKAMMLIEFAKNNNDEFEEINERNANYATYYMSLYDPNFIEYARNNSKVNKIFKDYPHFDIIDIIDGTEQEMIESHIDQTSNDVINNLDEDPEFMFDEDGNNAGFEQTETSGDVQWGWGDGTPNYKGLVNNDLKLYFNSLPRLINTSTDSGDYNYDLNNPLGQILGMTYEECSTELFNLNTNPNANKSIYHFVEAVKELANNKQKFASFIMLYNDMVNEYGDITEFGWKVWNTFHKPVHNVAELVVTKEGGVKIQQSNIYNNSVRKLYYDIYDDLKAGVENTSLGVYPKNQADIIKKAIAKKDRVLNLAKYARVEEVEESEILNDVTQDITNATIALQEIYKLYIPTIDTKSIDTYVNLTEDLTEKIDRINNIFSKFDSFYNAFKKSQESYNVKASKNRKEYARYYKEMNEYDEEIKAMVQSGMFQKPERPKPADIDFGDEYLDNIRTNISEIVSVLEPYIAVDIDLNSRNVEGNMSSDVGYYDYIHTLEQTFSDLESLEAYARDKFQFDEYIYSSILVEDEAHGIYGLYKYENGQYVPTDYARDLIRFHLIGGISNMQTSNNAMYKNMSDNDYFILAYRTFINGIEDYYKYNKIAKSKREIPTAYYTMPIPADAPKNFFCQMPKYSIDDFYGVNKEKEKSYIDQKMRSFAKSSNFDPTTNEGNVIIKAVNNATTDGGPGAGVLFNNQNNFVAKIFETLNSETTTVKVNDVLFLYDGGVIPTDSNIGYINISKINNNKVYYVLKYSPDGKAKNINTSVLIEADLIREKSSIEYDGDLTITNPKIVTFYNNQNPTATTIQDENVRSAIENIFAKEYLQNTRDAIEYNKNSAIYNILRRFILSEINNAIRLKQTMFTADGELKPGYDLDWYIVNPKTKKFQDKGRLTGNAFRYTKLFDIVKPNGDIVSVDDMLKDVIDISSTGVNDRAPHIDSITNMPVLTEEQKLAIDNAIEAWFDAFREAKSDPLYEQYKDIDRNVTQAQVLDFVTNYFIFVVQTEDLFQGDAKFYSDSKTSIKRMKENQAGGNSYGLASTVIQDGINPFDPEVENIPYTDIQVGEGDNVKTITYPRRGSAEPIPLTLRTGFRAITVENIIRGVRDSKVIYDRLRKAGVPIEMANKISSAFGYVDANKAKEIQAIKDLGEKPNYDTENTKVDDAQSYTSFYEAIRRIVIKGEFGKYKKLIEQLTDDTPLSQIDANELNSFIQAVKNYYYDQYADKNVRLHRPRQIKNAEFILIPKLLEGTQLYDLAVFMMDNDIDQVNTKETSKASNANVLNIWDENDDLIDLNSEEFTKQLNQPGVIANYSYTFLYEQGQVAQHLKNAENKAGVQIMKKILDNLVTSLAADKDSFISCYVANIEESFDNMCESLGVRFDENYNIVSTTGDNIDFSKLNEMGLRELRRLGADENLLDYFRFKEGVGESINYMDTLMPSFMNVVGHRLENIAQSVFNNRITIQRINGGHLTQITNNGLRPSKLTVNDGDNLTEKQQQELKGITKDLKYYPNGEPVIEVKMPRWAAELVGISEQDIVDKSFATMIGYRIPTEGKQSMAILKIVGLLDDAYGSTIAVPDGWVTQTGADFDIDSIYTMMKYVYKGKDGKVKEISYIDGNDEESAMQRYRRYVYENSTKEAIAEIRLGITDEEKDHIRKVVNRNLLDEYADEEDVVNNKLRELLENESEIYAEIPDGIRDGVDNILRDKKYNKTYSQRVAELIKYLEGQNQDQVGKLLDIYKQIQEALKDYGDFRRMIYEESIPIINSREKDIYIKRLKERAALSGLLTFEEFSNLSIERQNTRKARTNKIINSAINILKDPSNAEEILIRSNFDGISEANKDIDILDGQVNVKRNISYFGDQLHFRRNAIGGLALKAFSVTRDSLNSINNVCKTTINDKTKKITIYYDSAKYNEAVISQAYGAVEHVNINGKDMLKVVHDRLAWSNNNRNVVGYVLTSYSSQTTAHILDAVKEGAIPNENIFTFGAYKTLLDVGTDHYTAMLWLRQPAMTVLCDNYFKTQSSFNRVNMDIIELTIKTLAKRFEKDGKKLGKNYAEVADNTPISTIIANLDKLMGTDIIEESNNIIIDPNEITDMYKDRTNTPENVYKQIKQIYMFKHLKDLSNTIERHGRVLNTDKAGAKQTLFQTARVFENIYDIYDNGEANVLYAQGYDKEGKTKRMPLLEAVYPGSQMINFTRYESNEDHESNTFVQITDGIKSFLKYNANRKSAYPTLNAFLNRVTAPSYIMNSERFETQHPQFVGAIKYLDVVLGRKVDEKTYDEFQKYVLNHMYANKADVIKYESYIDKDGNIKLEVGEDDDYQIKYKGRIYGYGYNEEIKVDIKNPANPSEKDYQSFRKLSPAQKIHYLKQIVDDNSDSIFKYLKTNLYNDFEARNKGISTQTIRFEDNNTNPDYIHQLFMEAYNSSNRLIRDAMIDLIKYSFVVEGYNYGMKKVSKIIDNRALYTGLAEGGTGIVDQIKSGIFEVNQEYCETNKLYENFIRSHSNNRFIPSHRMRRINGKKERNYDESMSKLRVYTFNLAATEDLEQAKEMGVVKENSTGEVSVNNYIVFVDQNKQSTLYKIMSKELADGTPTQLFLYPLNKLDTFEYGDKSANVTNRQFLTGVVYEAIYYQLSANKFAINNSINASIELAINRIKESRKTDYKKTTFTGVIKDGDGFYNMSKNKDKYPTIASFVDNIKRTFDNNSKARTKIFYKPSVTTGTNDLADLFVKDNVPTVQLIPNAEGDMIAYSISRKTINIKNFDNILKKVPEEYRKDLVNYKDNLAPGIEYMTDLYEVVRTPVKKNVNDKRNSSIIIEESSIDSVEEITGLSDLGKINVRAFTAMRRARNRRNDYMARNALNRAKQNDIYINNAKSIDENGDLAIRINADYYEQQTDRLLNQIEEFCTIGGINQPIDHPDVIASMITSDTLRSEFVRLILESSTFGDEISMIYNMSKDNLSPEAKDAVDRIIKSIDKIKNNSKIRNAIVSYFNEYISSFSSNALITEGFTTVHDMIETDETIAAYLFGDVNEINGAATQIILKQINTHIKEAEFKGNERVKEFRKRAKAIQDKAKAAGATINPENMIDYTNAKFIGNFTEDFIKDRDKIKADHFDLIKRKGTIYDPEVVRSQYNKDVWFAENTEQQYVSDYYKKMNENLATVITDDIIDYYVKYLKLNHERITLYNKYIKTDEDIKRMEEINEEIRSLTDFNYVIKKYPEIYRDARKRQYYAWKATKAKMANNTKAYNNYMQFVNNISKKIEPFLKDNPDIKASEKLSKFIMRKREIQAEYFQSYTTKEWENLKKHHQDIIHNLTYPNGSKFPLPVSAIENDPRYIESIAWLAHNVIYEENYDFIDSFINYASALKRTTLEEESTDEKDDIYFGDKYDYRKILDGRKFSAIDRLKIKNAAEKKYSTKRDGYLIRSKPTQEIDNIEVYNDLFWDSMDSGADRADNENRKQLVNDINEIIQNAYDEITGKIYLSVLTLNELRKLDALYKELYTLDNKIQGDDSKSVANFIKAHVEFVSDEDSIIPDNENFKKVLLTIENDKERKEYATLFKRIQTGRYNRRRSKKGSDKSNTNRYLYQYPVLKKTLKPSVRDKYIDKEKTEALRWIKNNVEVVKTDYYIAAQNEAKKNGTYKQWFETNHVFNPYTNEFEPLYIWTRNVPTAEAKKNFASEENPTFFNRRSLAKEGTENPKYRKYGSNYNGSAKYHNPDIRNEYEREMVELMQEYIQEFASINKTTQRHFDAERAPYRMTTTSNPKNIAKSIIAALGLDWRVSPDRGINDNFGFIHDRDVPNPLMEDVITGYERHVGKSPVKDENEDDTAFNKRLEAYREREQKIKEYNDELHKKLADKDYVSVFEEYIRRAVDQKAKEEVKDQLYILLEYYKKYKEGYQTNYVGELRKDGELSTRDSNVYKMQQLARTIEHLEIYGKRMFNNQYRPKTKFDKIMSLMQNMTSAKFMMFNFTGGISNILTGETNIAYEAAASEYFSPGDLRKATGDYTKALIGGGILLGINKDTATNFEDGFFKLMNVIDYDRIKDTGVQFSTIEMINKARNFAYSPQTAGEHMMQNRTLLAMAYSNKIIMVGDKPKVIDRNYYRYLSEIAAIKQVLANNSVLEAIFDKFQSNIKNDDKTRHKYETFERSVYEDFFRIALNGTNKRKYGEQFIEARKEQYDKYMNKYETLPTIKEQFELKDGYVVLKENALIGWKEAAEFANKVIGVNKQIHGIYDKIGAATIESTAWFGSLLMQYHKHIWNGILKHFRVKGYYNETTQSRRKGMYASLFHFLSSEGVAAEERIKKAKREGEVDGIDVIALYLKEYCRAVIDTFANAAFNYNLMSETDRANIRRIEAQLAASAAAFMLYISAAYYLYEDDENLLANWGIYTADRWLTETNAFGLGFIAEMERTLKNPFAVQTSINDYLKIISTAVEMIMQGEEFNPYFSNGQYAGENKFWVYFSRQIPAWRGIQRIMNLDSNNRYYKLGDNLFNVIPTERIVEGLHNL